MIEVLEKRLCSGCTACAVICPKNCISMKEDGEGFLYPVVDKNSCIKCGLCIKTCPIIEKKQKKDNEDPRAYAVVNKNEEIRKKSSSGGVFYQLALYVIRRGGVVFGAAFNDDFSVSHKWIDSEDKINIFQGSKYVQSKIEDSFVKAKDFLDSGRLVYFSGTPCQIGGLLSFLKKPYDNLITQDFICHGVPSPMVWKKYLDYKKQGKKIKEVSFRDKRNGWRKFTICLKFDDGSEYSETLQKDLYLRAFLKNLCLRQSCYNCSFKTISRNTDITLADFWGVEKEYPELYDERGISLVLLQSATGEKIFNEIKDGFSFQSVALLRSVAKNLSINNCAQKPKERDAFMKELGSKSFLSAKRFCEDSFFDRVFSVLKRIKNKMFRRKK